MATLSTSAWSGVEVHATCATDALRDSPHVRTLRSEMTRALAGARTPAAYTIDVALVRLDATSAPTSLEVRAELRAIVSDARGRILWSSAARAAARGRPRDRALLERDAVAAAARDLAQLVRARL